MSARRSESFPRIQAADAETSPEDSGHPATPASAGPTDEFLISSMLGGDQAALGKLIERYDRLVRFTIFRASRSHAQADPQWVDSLASETWIGFVHSMQRSDARAPGSVATYLIQVARFRTISALRGRRIPVDSLSELESQSDAVIAEDVDPVEAVAVAEELAALRDCVAGLPVADQSVYAQRAAITERRWHEAANALGMPESTMRSRWKNILVALRRCLEGKPAGKKLAQRQGKSDSSSE